MLPIGDENPPRLTPFVNWIIIAICVLVFIWQVSGGSEHFMYTVYLFGLIPFRLIMGEGHHTLVTNIFLHGGWLHLIGNMLFLQIFGDNIEDVCGHFRYVAFYLICGVTGSALWLLTAWGSMQPAVGASGAISGVMGAYFIMFPEARIRTLVSIGFFWRLVRVPAYIMIGLWFVYQIILAIFPINMGIAYWAHVGGFITGLGFASLIKPRERSRPARAYNIGDSRFR